MKKTTVFLFGALFSLLGQANVYDSVKVDISEFRNLQYSVGALQREVGKMQLEWNSTQNKNLSRIDSSMAELTNVRMVMSEMSERSMLHQEQIAEQKSNLNRSQQNGLILFIILLLALAAAAVFVVFMFIRLRHRIKHQASLLELLFTERISAIQLNLDAQRSAFSAELSSLSSSLQTGLQSMASDIKNTREQLFESKKNFKTELTAIHEKYKEKLKKTRNELTDTEKKFKKANKTFEHKLAEISEQIQKSEAKTSKEVSVELGKLSKELTRQLAAHEKLIDDLGNMKTKQVRKKAAKKVQLKVSSNK